MTITTGQKLWLVPSRGIPREVEVGKVGRKWIYLIPAHLGRINIETLEVDGVGYSSPGQCYGSRTEWEETATLNKAWDRFRHNLPSRRPKGVMMEDLAKVRELLRMETR